MAPDTALILDPCCLLSIPEMLSPAHIGYQAVADIGTDYRGLNRNTNVGSIFLVCRSYQILQTCLRTLLVIIQASI